MAGQPMTVRRTARLVRQSDPETYNIILIQRGSARRTWGRDEATYGPYDLHASDSSRPYELRWRGDQGLIQWQGMSVPKRLLPLPRYRTDRLDGRPISVRGGIGALLRGFITRLTTDPRSYLPSDGPRLGTVLVDLASALFAHELEADHASAAEDGQRALNLRIRAFIQRHLRDPDLTPAAVAAAHHISTSYLHRLFQHDGITVAAWIREQRLERARRDLADPALRGVPVHQIASRWGFSDAAVFSRAFRTGYGVAPKDYRHQALRTVDASSTVGYQPSTTF